MARRRREMEALAEMQRRERELMAARKKYDEMMKRRYKEEQENEEKNCMSKIRPPSKPQHILDDLELVASPF